MFAALTSFKWERKICKQIIEKGFGLGNDRMQIKWTNVIGDKEKAECFPES